MSVSRKIRRYRGWIAVGTLAAIAAGTWFVLQRTADQDPKTTYQTQKVTKETLSVTISGTGNLEIGDTQDVWPTTAGTVATLDVAEGEAVSTGTVLYTLDEADAEEATARAYATYLQSVVSVTQAKASLTRAKNTLADLQERQATPSSGPTATPVTDEDIAAAKADVNSAAANVNSASAQSSSALLSYKQARADEEDLEVTAPCSGVVYSISIEEGDSVSSGSSSTGASGSSATAGSATGATGATAGGSGTAPVVIVPEQPLVAKLTVNETDVSSIKLGQRANIEFDALDDATATGKVIEIADSGTVSQGVVTFDVTVSIDVADPRLREGMSVAASVVTNVVRDALTVPNSAIKTAQDDSSYVLVMADGKKTPTKATVETGLANATSTVILNGLSEGDTIVTRTITTSDDDSSSSSSSSNSQRSGFIMGGGGPGGAPGGGMR